LCLSLSTLYTWNPNTRNTSEVDNAALSEAALAAKSKIEVSRQAPSVIVDPALYEY
jgi:hypothetical protein